MVNKWLVHIKKTMKKMKATGKYVAGKGLGQVIKAARLTWHKVKKGGGDGDAYTNEETPESTGAEETSESTGSTGAQVEPDPPAPPAGGKRRRKTRRRRASRRR